MTPVQLKDAEALMKRATKLKAELAKLAQDLSDFAAEADGDYQAHQATKAVVKELDLVKVNEAMDGSVKGLLTTFPREEFTLGSFTFAGSLVSAHKYKPVTKLKAELLDKGDKAFLEVLKVLVKHSKPGAIQKRLQGEQFTTSMLEDCNGIVGLAPSDDWSVTKVKS